MSEKCEKWSNTVFPKAREDVLGCLVLSTTQHYSVYCHREVKKPENIRISEAGIREYMICVGAKAVSCCRDGVIL